MTNGPEVKVVLKQDFLHGSSEPDLPQGVATVYIKGREYRISAPPDAKGDVLDWVPHLTVRNPSGPNCEDDIRDGLAAVVLNALKKDLERRRREANRPQGMHPDGVHYDALICMNGHVLHSSGGLVEPELHCPKCGAPCIAECRYCEEPIRGAASTTLEVGYSRPLYCHKCGQPYPWIEDRLRTVRELIEHDVKLSSEDRTKLLGDLQYVMSDPGAELAPAKKKLIEIKLENAPKCVREFILDLMAKTAAEIIKG